MLPPACHKICQVWIVVVPIICQKAITRLGSQKHLYYKLLLIAYSKLDIGNFEELCTVINFINRSKQCLQTACF